MARILVVEDNDPVRWTLAALLRSDGHDVDQAANGQQALSQFANHPTDMILMDLHMPVMDGLEACQRLRQASQVPILMISTLNNPTIEKQVLESGANGFIAKPLEFDILMAWVRDASRGSGTPPPRSGPDSGPGPASAPPNQNAAGPARHLGPFPLRGPWAGTGIRRHRPATPGLHAGPGPGNVHRVKKFDLSPPFEYTRAYGA